MLTETQKLARLAIFAALITVLTLLGGCAEALLRVGDTSLALSEALSERIESNPERRKQARDDCWRKVKEYAEKLWAEGKHDEYWAFMRERSPGRTATTTRASGSSSPCSGSTSGSS